MVTMKTAIQKARAAHRQVVEVLYEDTCNITEYKETVDEATKLSQWEEKTMLSDEPCKLSFESSPSSQPDGTATAVSQLIKLFLAPELTVRPGSKISVTHQGHTVDYANSGVSAVYPTHQELLLTLFDGWG